MNINMKRFGRTGVVIAALLAAPVVHAAKGSVPIADRPDLPATTGSGKPLSQQALQEAIVNGGKNGPRKWAIVPAGDGKTLRGTYRVRSHVVTVDIVPSSTSYSVKYADSVNMNYRGGSTPVIHPSYNQWVEQLIIAINYELTKL